jgi:site-specific DNA-adenine methylase
MFLYLMSLAMKSNAYLSDTNVELITAYKIIKVNPIGDIEIG